MIGVAANQQLLGSVALQFELIRPRRSGCSTQVRLRRLGSPAGVGQGISQLSLQSAALRSIVREPLERKTEEFRSSVESQRLGCSGGRHSSVLGRLVGLLRTLPMHRQCLGIGVGRCLQRGSKPLMYLLESLWLEMPHHRFTDAVVKSLNRIVEVPSPTAHQVDGAENRQRPFGLAVEIRRLRGESLGYGMARDRNDCQQLAGVLWQE